MRNGYQRLLSSFVCSLIMLSFVSAQEDFHFLIGGSAASGKSNLESFSTYYPEKFLTYGAIAGPGFGNNFIIGKYSRFFAKGTSTVEQIAVEGTAEWKQTNYGISVRMYFLKILVIDVGYMWLSAEETTSTKDDLIPELKAASIKKDNGLDVLFGISLPLTDSIRINLEVESINQIEGSPDIGLTLYGAGINVIF